MTAQLVAFPSRLAPQFGWSNEDLAELYRVEHALVQAGMHLETDYGQTDEGDPWFIFCRANGEILVHIARFDGLYRLFSPALSQPLTGYSFATLTKSFLGMVPVRSERSSQVVLHPAALLSVLVLTIFYAADLVTGSGAEAAEVPGTSNVTTAMDLSGSVGVDLWTGITPTPAPEKVPLKAAFGSYISALNHPKNEASAVSSNGYLMLVTSVIGFASGLQEAASSQLVTQSDDATASSQSTGAGEQGSSRISDNVSHTPLNEISTSSFDVIQPQPFEALSPLANNAPVPPGLTNIASVGHRQAENVFDLDVDGMVHANPVTQQVLPGEIADLGTVVPVADEKTRVAQGEQKILDAGAETATAVLSMVADVDSSLTTKPVPVMETVEKKNPVLAMDAVSETSVMQQLSKSEITAAQVDAFIDASLDFTRRGAFDYDDLMVALGAGAQTISTSRLTVAEILMLRDAERLDSSSIDLEAKLQIDEFLRTSTDAEVLVRNGSILVYDAADSSELGSAEIISWDLAAGGTIALVGHFDGSAWAA